MKIQKDNLTPKQKRNAYLGIIFLSIFFLFHKYLNQFLSYRRFIHHLSQKYLFRIFCILETFCFNLIPFIKSTKVDQNIRIKRKQKLNHKHECRSKTSIRSICEISCICSKMQLQSNAVMYVAV